MDALNLEIVESPCIGVCTLDDRGWCMGCFRTADEIQRWPELRPSERRAIMERLPDRAGD